MVKERYGLYLDKELVKSIKKICIDEEKSLSQLVEELLKKRLKSEI